MARPRPALRTRKVAFATFLGALMLSLAALPTDGLGERNDLRPALSARYDVVNPDYRGTFGGDSKALIAVRTKKGRPVKGLFQAKNTELDCEDGSRQVHTLAALIIRFRTPRTFDGQSYAITPSGFQSYRAVRGRISPDGDRARGRFLVIAHSPYPEDDPGCNTYGWVGWHAERVWR